MVETNVIGVSGSNWNVASTVGKSTVGKSIGTICESPYVISGTYDCGKLANPKTIKHFWNKDKVYQFIPFIATFVFVVLTDLLKGVGIGLLSIPQYSNTNTSFLL